MGRQRDLRATLPVAQAGLCALCREPMEPGDVTLDHIIPRSLGGSDDDDNLQAAHRRCNLAKGNIENTVTYCWRCRKRSGTEAASRRHYFAHVLKDWKRSRDSGAGPVVPRPPRRVTAQWRFDRTMGWIRTYDW